MNEMILAVGKDMGGGGGGVGGGGFLAFKDFFWPIACARIFFLTAALCTICY